MGGSPYYETAPELLFVSLFALVGFAPSFSGRPLVLRIARCAALLAAFSHGCAFLIRHVLSPLAHGLTLFITHVLPLSPTRIALGLACLVRNLFLVPGFLGLCAAKDKQAGAHQ